MFRATIAGNLTRDAIFGESENGNHWLFATVAVTAKVRPADGSEKLVDGITSYIEVKAFKGLAKNAGPRMLKGMRVNITGDMSEEEKTYNGETKRVLVMIAKDIAGSFLFPPKDPNAPRNSDTDIAAKMNAEAAAVPATSRFEDDEDEG